jgi:hypothetical protein
VRERKYNSRERRGRGRNIVRYERGKARDMKGKENAQIRE